jgi:cyclophilin family peptidyl-prolyl cis-trans isomerase
VPETAENFRQLCTGEAVVRGKKVSYKNTSLTKALPNVFIEAGDILGDGSATIYGENTLKESTGTPFSQKGLVAMVNTGDHTVGSKFFITLGDFSHLDYSCVVVGEVIEGLSNVYELSRLGNSDGQVQSKALIADCKEGHSVHI